jgi:hypothetical protein
LNQANELYPNQSYTIEADQRNGCEMILAGKTQLKQMTRESESTKVELSVRESEAEGLKSGLYFYLSVVPEKACQDLVLQFQEGTVWKALPGFIRRCVARPQSPNRNWHSQTLLRQDVALACHHTAISHEPTLGSGVEHSPSFVRRSNARRRLQG